MIVNEFWVLLLGVKNKNLGIRLEKNTYRKNRGQNLPETGKGSDYNQEKWLEEFLGNKGAFYNGNASDDSKNDDDNCTENIEAVVRRCSSK